MKKFGGHALLLNRNDINTDEIIPARYLTENAKKDLKPYLLEDLRIDGFDPRSDATQKAEVIITRANFGCGSSREHAVWVFEVNGINVVIAESFARIFRQNMFNCGLLALTLPKNDIDTLFNLEGHVDIGIDIDQSKVMAGKDGKISFDFQLSPFERELIMAGGWLAYANKKY